MENKIFLEKMRHKKSTNTSSGLNIELKGSRRLLPFEGASKVVSQIEQYSKERGNCNTIRLTCQVNPVCSNVLFNRISEIVKDEGSSAVTFLNYGITGSAEVFDGVMYKPSEISFWSGGTMNYQSVDTNLMSKSVNTPLKDIEKDVISPNGRVIGNINHPTNAIRDTQLSNNGFVYHCGLDILNNHLIRSNTFKAVCKINSEEAENPDVETGYTAFNTIADLMRDASGDKVIEKMYYPISSSVEGGTKFVGKHLYLYDEILTFKEAISKRLIEKYNGWFGFVNRSKIKSYADFSSKDPKDMRMERPIMYMHGGDYIDMYPGRDLYSFVPKYNPYRDRMEKNWNYCITYPSSSTIEGFDYIIEPSNGSMKTIYFDENTRADNGAVQLVIYSKAKHGLVEGDKVNIYKNYTNESGDVVNELVIYSVEVDAVVDDFIFTTFTQNVQISGAWVQVEPSDMYSGFTVDGVNYSASTDGGKYFFDDKTYQRYFVVNDKYVNIDPTAQNITYKKVVNDIECDYYVRIFSRLPNFKFASGDTNSEYSIYNKEVKDGVLQPSLLEVYQQPENEFESHVSRLAFAKNIYSDDIGEIVFTDDIKIANIHDNLNRPLTELYLTIVKNNAGYKEWYGYDGTEVAITSDTVEYSHCFGKITCGFELADETVSDIDTKNIKTMQNVVGINFGYDVGQINPGRDVSRHLTPPEIDFKTDIHFYGDLCYYDNYNAIERSIQPILHRFNTAQRESSLASMRDYFFTYEYDEITRDDYDVGDSFTIDQNKESNCNSKAEGYYYVPHYNIPIKSFGRLETVMPQFLDIQVLVWDGDSVRITTRQYHFLSPGDKAVLYDISTDKYYNLTAIPSRWNNDRVFTCKVFNEDGTPTNEVDGDRIPYYKLFKTDNLEIPTSARLLKDGTCRYLWRNVINNGSMGGDSNLEEYPFTNGAFYINKHIDLYLRRQDPYGNYHLYSEDDIDVFGVEPSIEEINDYYSEKDIEC